MPAPDQEMSDKVPPAYDGNPNSLTTYCENLRIWEMATSVTEERRGPLAVMRLTGSCIKLRSLLDVQRLATKNGSFHEDPDDTDSPIIKSGTAYLLEQVKSACGRVVSEVYFGKWRRLTRMRRGRKQGAADYILSFHKLLQDFQTDATAVTKIPEVLVALMLVEGANLTVEEHQRILMRLPAELTEMKTAQVEAALRSVLLSREDDGEMEKAMALYGADEQFEAEEQWARENWQEFAEWNEYYDEYWPTQEAEAEPQEEQWADEEGALWVRSRKGKGKPKGKGKSKGAPKGGGKGKKGKGKGAGGKGAGMGEFPGLCWHCGKLGHKASDCKSAAARAATETTMTIENAAYAADGGPGEKDSASVRDQRGTTTDRNEDPKVPGSGAYRHF